MNSNNSSGSNIVISSVWGRRLLPAEYTGQIDVEALASRVDVACRDGAAALEKLRALTASNWATQTWNTKDINAGVVSSLESIQTLGKAQIALQAITADLNQKSLDEQWQIKQHQDQISASQQRLEVHAQEIEELAEHFIRHVHAIRLLSDEVEAVQGQLNSLDPSAIRNELDAINRTIGNLGSDIGQLSTRLKEYRATFGNRIDAIHTQTVEAIATLGKAIEDQARKSQAGINESRLTLGNRIDAIHVQSGEAVATLKQAIDEQATKMVAGLNESQLEIQRAVVASHEYSDGRYDASLQEITNQKRAVEERLSSDMAAVKGEMFNAVAKLNEHALKSAQTIRRVMTGIGLLAVAQFAVVLYVLSH